MVSAKGKKGRGKSPRGRSPRGRKKGKGNLEAHEATLL